MKNISFFLSENFQFLKVKFSIDLNRHRNFRFIFRCSCGLLLFISRLSFFQCLGKVVLRNDFFFSLGKNI